MKKIRWILGGILAVVVALVVLSSPVSVARNTYSDADSAATPAPVAATPAPVPAENTITIPKINVHAPVVYVESTDEAQIQTALEGGVIHYGSTALPGQIGNVTIFGHSSNDWWEKGDYKFVFVLLDKLTPGDKISIDFQSVRYAYEVTGSRVVEANDVGVLAPTTTATLSLITCTPPGTSLRRLVVTAKQVDPDPLGATKLPVQAKATAAANAPPPASELVGSKSFMNGISNVVTTIVNFVIPASRIPD